MSSNRVIPLSVVGTVVLVAGQAVLAQPCTPGLDPSYLGESSFAAGFNNKVHTLVAGDLGNGPRLFATGRFRQGGGEALNGAAEWDGVRWSPLGSESLTMSPWTADANNSSVIFDDGTGPALYVVCGGMYVGSTLIDGVAKWDGTSWSQAGQSLNLFSMQLYIRTLRVLDDGSGPKLYAVGNFGWASPNTPSTVARLEGNTWVQVGPPYASSPVRNANDITWFDSDGDGPLPGKLYITAAEGPNAIYALEGNTWVATFPQLIAPTAHTLLVYDLGDGPAMFVFGSFRLGTSPQSAIVRLKDGVLSTMPKVWPGSARCLNHAVTFDDGTGPALYISGDFTLSPESPTPGSAGLIKWDGNDWRRVAALGSEEQASRELAAYTHQGRPALFIGSITGATDATTGASGFARYLALYQGCNPSCDADFNRDGDVGTDGDIEAFFACLGGNCCARCLTADFNGDGDFGTDADIESFFRVLAGGAC